MPTGGWKRFVPSIPTIAASPAENAAIFVPSGWKGDGTRRAVLWVHGYVGSSTFGLPGLPFGSGSDLQKFARRGHLIAGADLGGGSTWGNALARERVDDIWRYLKQNYGVRGDKFVVYCASMGGQLALNYAVRKPYNVAAIGGFVPVINLDDIHDRNPIVGFNAAADIETAYTDLAGYEAALAASPSNSPYRNISLHAAQDVPMRFGIADSDDIALAQYAYEFDAAVSSCTTFSQGEVEHVGSDTADYLASDLLGFLEPHILPGGGHARTAETTEAVAV